LLCSEAEYYQLTSLTNASQESIARLYKLSLGAPLALHFIIGQLQSGKKLDFVINAVENACNGAENFYKFVFEEEWKRLSMNTRELLYWMTEEKEIDFEKIFDVVFSLLKATNEDKNQVKQEMARWFLTFNCISGVEVQEFSLHPWLHRGIRSRFVEAAESLKINGFDLFIELISRDLILRDKPVVRITSRKINLRMETERFNLYNDLLKFQAACVANQADSNRSFDLLLRIWDITGEILWLEGYWRDYLKCGGVVLDCAVQLRKWDIEGRLLNGLGWAQMEQGNLDVAERNFTRSLYIFQSINDQISQGQSLCYMSVLHFRRRYFGLSLKCYRKALHIVEEGLKQSPSNQHLLRQRAELHNLLGNLYLKLWNIRACRRELVLALQGFRNLQKRFVSPTSTPYSYFQAGSLLNLGQTAMTMKAYSRAKNYFARCYRLSEELKRPDTKAGALLRLAELAQIQGHFKAANQLAKRAQDIAGQEIPPIRNQAITLRSQMRGERQQQLKAKFHQIKMISVLTTDLAIHTPMVLLQSIINYGFFVTSRCMK